MVAWDKNHPKVAPGPVSAPVSPPSPPPPTVPALAPNRSKVTPPAAPAPALPPTKAPVARASPLPPSTKRAVPAAVVQPPPRTTPSPLPDAVRPRPRPRPRQKGQPPAAKATDPPPAPAKNVVVSMPRVITPAPEKPADAARHKRTRERYLAEEAAGFEDAAPPEEADASESEPVAKKVKVSARRDRRPPAVVGTKKNSKKCKFCKSQGYECWRQGGPSPRGSCFECASAKQKCADTEANWAEIQQEKMLEKVEKRLKAKGKKAVKPVSRSSTKPRRGTTLTPGNTQVSKPAPPPVAGPSKRKAPKSAAVVPTSDDESEVPLKDVVKQKKVVKPAPIVLSSDSEVVPASKGKGKFQGTWCHPHISFTDAFCSD
jgi:hypothetical protein